MSSSKPISSLLIGIVVGVTLGLLIPVFAIYELGIFHTNPQSLNNYLQASITTVALLLSVGSVVFIEIIRALTALPQQSHALMKEHVSDVLDQAEGQKVSLNSPPIKEMRDRIDKHNELVELIKTRTKNINRIILTLFATASLCIAINIYLFISTVTFPFLFASVSFLFLTAMIFLIVLQYFFGAVRADIEVLRFPQIEQKDLEG